MTATAGPFGTAPVIAVGGDPRGTPGADIATGPFWPQIKMDLARKAMRIDGNVTEERLRDAIIEATVTVIEALAAWKIARQREGITNIEDTGGEKIDGKSPNTHRWFRAVYAFAGASLAERYRGTDATGEGIKRALIIESPIEDLRRDALWAIADITARPRTVVELI